MGILVNTGFDVGSSNPIDSRTVKNTTNERDALVADGLVYENLKVYCKDTKKEYRWTGTDWETVVSSGDLTDYQKKTDNTLTTTDKTIVGAINEVKDSIITNYENLTNKPSIEGVELDGNKSLSDLGITIYDDTEVKSDIASLKEYKQNKTDNTLDTTDKTITGSINEVNGNLLDTVGFSADYKNIILNRKNGLNPYTIPISAIINNASLAELKDIDSTDVGNGKILVYDGTTNKHKYVNSSITDELVKMDSATDAKYLSDLIDKSTVINDNGVLKVKKLDGQEVTITEINYLKGLTMNVMDLVSAFSNGGVKVLNTPLNTASELDTMDRTSFTDGISYIVYVLADETHSNAKTTYLCTKTSTTFFGNADSQRNFTANPIDLANEVTGKLGTSNIDVDNLWTLLTINDTYKTLTTNNEIFGTHGAKAMYDELTTAIGEKANTSDIPTKVSELENDSNFVELNDTQASDTTTYSSNKIADLITEATMGKDLGNLLIAKSSADMFALATKDNLGKSALYTGDSTINYTNGEIYELYWDAININYISFVYSPTIKFNFTKIQEILGTRTSLTVTGEYGYQNQKVWRITTDIGMAGDILVNYGIISKQDKFVFGDKFKYTYDDSKKNSYRWLPTGNVPTWNLTKAWYNIDKFIMYNGTDDIYKKGRVYRLTGDKVAISTDSTEISNLAIDKDKFLNNCSLRGDITFRWMGEYFALSTNNSGDAKQYTKKQFNSWGITYDGDITIVNKYIKIVTSKDTSINNWEWKDVTDTVKVDDTYKTLTTTDNVFGTHGAKAMYDELTTAIGGKANDDEVVKKTDISTTINSASTDDEIPTGKAIFKLLQAVYPVGSVYINTIDINPSTIFGFGTWERVAQNMTLWGASANGESGATKYAGLPDITGEVGFIKPLTEGSYYQGVNYKNGCFTKSKNITATPNTRKVEASDISDDYGETGLIKFDASSSNSIYGNSTTVQPPALVVNIWKRVS